MSLAISARDGGVTATYVRGDSSVPGLCRLIGVYARVFAEFKTNLQRERQLEEIAKAKAAGVYRGRKPSIDQAQVEKLEADGLGATEIAKRLMFGAKAT